jgi:3-hydroxybutyryl-CoA dehydratase
MKMTNTYTSRGHYFEEFSRGEIVVSAGRTITEADIVSFAGLAGDYTQIHTNAEFAHHGFFGQRVAHGLLTMAIASGLLAQLGLFEGTILAFHKLIWKFSLPVFIGDTIHAQATVNNLKAMKRLGGGAVTFDVQIINQGKEVVQSGQWTLLIASQPERA